MEAVQKMVLNNLPVVALSVSRGVSLWDAVPNEVRDTSLSLGTTK